MSTGIDRGGKFGEAANRTSDRGLGSPFSRDAVKPENVPAGDSVVVTFFADRNWLEDFLKCTNGTNFIG